MCIHSRVYQRKRKKVYELIKIHKPNKNVNLPLIYLLIIPFDRSVSQLVSGGDAYQES